MLRALQSLKIKINPNLNWIPFHYANVVLEKHTVHYPHIYLLLKETYAKESSQICLFLAGRAQFDSDHHQNRRLSSHSYSHESVICFVFCGLIFVKLRRVCVFSV